ncbi:MAG: DUF4926 domain-containing protein [Rubrobacteraceae bacterium]
MKTIKELDTVVLKRDLSGHRLERGDVGTVVHRYSTSEALEVEFITLEGETAGVLTLDAEDVRYKKIDD